MYLAVYDLIFFEIPINALNLLVGIVIGFNIITAVLRVFYSSRTFILGDWSNLLSGILLASIFYIVVKVTKEKAMGMGDVYLMLAIGLSLGLGRSIFAYLTTLMVASIVGIVISLLTKKFRQIVIPLVPFIFIGFLFALALPNNIIILISPF